MIEGKSALLFETSCGVDTDWNVLPIVFAFSEGFDIFEISYCPSSKLATVSERDSSQQETHT